MALLSGTGERRRRVLTEQMLTTPSAAAGEADPTAAGAAGRPGRSYSESALRSQPALVDFVPSRYRTIALWSFLAGLAAGGLQTLYWYLPGWSSVLSTRGAAALDLASRGSLGAWFSSLLLAVSAVGSLAIYSIRRHKADDYRARYRVWLWAAAALVLLSSEAVAGLHAVLIDVMGLAAAKAGLGSATAWALGVAVVLFGGLAVRLGFELKPCRAASAAFCLALGSWAGVLAASLGWIPLEEGAEGVMTLAGLRMGGDLMLLAALLLYGRYVLLDARGELPARSKAKKKAGKKKTAANQTAAGDEPIHSPAGGKRSHAAATEAARPVPKGRSDLERVPVGQPLNLRDTEEEEDEYPAGGSQRKLSKAERRRLRREKRVTA